MLNNSISFICSLLAFVIGVEHRVDLFYDGDSAIAVDFNCVVTILEVRFRRTPC